MGTPMALPCPGWLRALALHLGIIACAESDRARLVSVGSCGRHLQGTEKQRWRSRGGDREAGVGTEMQGWGQRSRGRRRSRGGEERQGWGRCVTGLHLFLWGAGLFAAPASPGRIREKGSPLLISRGPGTTLMWFHSAIWVHGQCQG